MTRFAAVTPILRMFDEGCTREFYLGFLGFALDFEHRFGDDLPLYMGVSREDCRLHLSGHHGDACPGAHVRIVVQDLRAYCTGLTAKAYRFARPGLPEPTPWGTVEITLTDPAGNRLTLVEAP